MEDILIKTKNASKDLLKVSNEDINKALLNIKDGILNNVDLILKANELDINNNINTIKKSLIDRLRLTKERITDLANSISDIINLPDYIGEVIEEIKRPNGLIIKKIRVPFGVIASIFEARPNVVIDIATLCLKTKNACILKGGKEAINTNICLVNIIKDSIKDIINPECVNLINSTDRKDTDILITKKEYIDLLIPRGSKGLINYICQNAKIPFIETGAGVCHLYVEKTANLDMAINIAINAKYQRPSVCNSIETILVDYDIKDKFLPLLAKEFNKLNIKLNGCKLTKEVIDCNLIDDSDYYIEYNDYIVNIKVVKDYMDAINHINTHSTKHSESIISENMEAVSNFYNLVDSACVYHNASTRFTDGGCFGFGAEIGISTTKLHARGPMGLKEITTYKYIS